MAKLRVSKPSQTRTLEVGKVSGNSQKVTVKRYGGMQSGANPVGFANSWSATKTTPTPRRRK